jgi:hypothetical protein
VTGSIKRWPVEIGQSLVILVKKFPQANELLVK